MTKEIVEVGNVYGYLEVISLHNDHHKGKSWLCRCTCGKEKVFWNSKFIGEKSIKSCGCKTQLQGGYSVKYNSLYHKWAGMVRRCYNPNHNSHAYYLDKGIQVDQEWKDDFFTFMNWALSNGYEEHLSLDRINNEMGYNAGNCRWTNELIQAQNRGIHKDNKTGVNGSRRMPNGRYHAYITREFKRYNLGMYDTITEVKEARERAEQYYEEHGTLEDYEPKWKRLRKKVI